MCDSSEYTFSVGDKVRLKLIEHSVTEWGALGLNHGCIPENKDFTIMELNGTYVLLDNNYYIYKSWLRPSFGTAEYEEIE